MMTDAMKPLGLSFWQLTTPRPMAEAGGRLFVDVTPILASPASRAGLARGLGEVRSADRGRAADRPRPRRLHPAAAGRRSRLARRRAPAPPAPIETDPAIVTELIERSEASLAALQRDIADDVRAGAVRLHPGGHPGAQAGPVRSAEPSR